MRSRSLAVLVLAASLAGCSGGGGGLSTASVLGGDAAPTPAATAAVPAAVPSKPTDRAFQAGAVSARAIKCGYNFDANQLRAAYLANEVGRGASNEEIAKVQQVYDVAHKGVAKATAEDPNYCTDKRTQEIKQDLGRLLAGDFEPPKRKVAKKQDEGMFSGWFDGGSEDSGPKFGSGDWWESQKEKVGG